RRDDVRRIFRDDCIGAGGRDPRAEPTGGLRAARLILEIERVRRIAHRRSAGLASGVAPARRGRRLGLLELAAEARSEFLPIIPCRPACLARCAATEGSGFGLRSRAPRGAACSEERRNQRPCQAAWAGGAGHRGTMSREHCAWSQKSYVIPNEKACGLVPVKQPVPLPIRPIPGPALAVDGPLPSLQSHVTPCPPAPSAKCAAELFLMWA